MEVSLKKAAKGAGAGGQADYRVLIATLQALQLATATAKARSRSAAGAEPAARPAPLVDILTGDSGWQDAVSAQQGCFNPLIAHCGYVRE